MKLELRGFTYEGPEEKYHRTVVFLDLPPDVLRLIKRFERDPRVLAPTFGMHGFSGTVDEFVDAVLDKFDDGRLQFRAEDDHGEPRSSGRWWVKGNKLERSAVAAEIDLPDGTMIAELTLVSAERALEILRDYRNPLKNPTVW